LDSENGGNKVMRNEKRNVSDPFGEFYEDAMLPGFCDWRLQFVFYRIYKDGKSVQGGAILGFPNRYNVIHYGCENVSMRNLSGVACYEGDNHWKDPARSDHQIDFIWEEKQK
jgi:hypothetical protein